MLGSSPLTRGKRVPPKRHSEIEGLIPAHAGKTPLRRRRQGLGAAHPRSRGENGGRVAGLRGVRGSSPLTRGKLGTTARCLHERRLIPAHAGKTSTPQKEKMICRAHPRSRGENVRARQASGRRVGSSPLTRGKRVWERASESAGRLIPAHAGKTRESLSSGMNSRAHPRSRGENRFHNRCRGYRDGSSPLTRGKQRRPRKCQGHKRLIPAHAGKT